MAESVNILLQLPPRGGSVGVWDTPVNGNFNSFDGWTGGVASISLSSSNVTLSKPTGTATPSAGPTQAENAVIKLTGTLSANIVITLPLPGKYIVKNSCTVGAFYVQARALGTGSVIGLPDGRAVTIWNDGTDVDFADVPEVGSALDLHTNTTTLPAWMTACTTLPYLIKNGGVHTSSLYPALATRLGSTYGGNGITTFGVMDELSRIRLPVDGAGTTVVNRITTAICGINGTTFGSAGGSQSLQSHNHTASDSGHQHGVGGGFSGASGGAATLALLPGNGISTSLISTAIITVNATGAGNSQNMPPAIVSFLPLVKT